MKTSILRCLAALFLCGTSLTALADDTNYIINEDFSSLKDSGFPTSFNGWTLSGGTCAFTNDNKSLKIENMSGKTGYAITKALGFTGDVQLSFSYAKYNDDADMKVTIQNGGKIEENNQSSITFPITNLHTSGFETKTYILKNVTATTTIKFEKTILKNVYLDDVKVIKLGSLTLDETIDSSEPISVNKDRSCTVATQRTLSATIWNTMCLPFDLTHEQAITVFGEGVQLRTYSGYDATNKAMNFESATNVSAGTPFLVKPLATVTNPTFTNVTITDTPAQAVEHDNDGIQFVGTYAPVDLETDGTNLFITTTNTLAKPISTGNRMNGLRAYIVVPENFSTTATRLAISDDATAVITIQQSQPQSQTAYDLRGQRLQQPGKGLRIMNGKIILEK